MKIIDNTAVRKVLLRPDPNIVLWVLAWYVAVIASAFFVL